MSKRDDFEKMLADHVPYTDEKLDEALEDMLDEAEEEGHGEGYSEGYEDGKDGATVFLDEDTLEAEIANQLRARYHYLRHGGEWQRTLLPSDEFASPADNYTAGFLDALKLLGVKP